jgi:predicted deacylase
MLGMLSDPKSELPLTDRYWVEDPRENSGYLQGMMPSPVAGVFQAEIGLGVQVTAGQRWGTVYDPVSGSTSDVIADIDGLAFLTRNLVKVKQGDALGGILPITQPGKFVLTIENNLLLH